MQIGIQRIEYVEVPDGEVAIIKAWMKNSEGSTYGMPGVPIIKVLRENRGIGLKEAKDIYDAILLSYRSDQAKVTASRF